MASSGTAEIHSSAWAGASHTGMRSWTPAETPLLPPVKVVRPHAFRETSKLPQPHPTAVMWKYISWKL